MKSAFLGPALLGSSKPTDPHSADAPRMRQRTPGRRRRLAALAPVVAALVVGYGVGIAHAADPQLDQALLALEKAEALVQNSSAEGAPEQVQRRFDRHTDRAVSDIERAMSQIAAAKDAYDNP